MAFVTKPRIVIARHVFCHIDDWDEFIETMSVVCGPDSTVCIEVPYVADMLTLIEEAWDAMPESLRKQIGRHFVPRTKREA